MRFFFPFSGLDNLKFLPYNFKSIFNIICQIKYVHISFFKKKMQSDASTSFNRCEYQATNAKNISYSFRTMLVIIMPVWCKRMLGSLQCT